MADAVAKRGRSANQRLEQRQAERHDHEQRKHFFDKYEWWFVVVGLVGNSLFFVGSVCFLFQSLETFAISLFIAGSCFMLVSSSAESIAEYSRNQLE